MANAINILFAVPNFRDVQAAIGTVQASLDKLARAGISSYDRQKQGAEKSFREIAKSADRSARDAARAQERAAKDAQKAQDRAAKEATRSIEKAEQEKLRAVDKAAKESVRIRNAANRQALADWKRDLAEQNAAHTKAIREHESRARSVGRVVGGGVTRALGTVGKVAGYAATLGGGFAIADSIGRGIQREATAGTIFRGASEKGDFKNAKDVEALAEATAIATGGTTEDMLAGLDKFVRKTGDLGAAKKVFEDLAKLAAATGANFEDMGDTAAEVQNILNEFKQGGDTDRVMRAFAGQGRAGAIDIKDLGQYGGRITSGAAKFQGNISENIESLGGIAQLAKKLGGATGPAEATEAVARLADDMTERHEAFRYAGIEVFADKGRTKLRNAEDVITEAVVKNKGDMSKIKPLFGQMSFRAAAGAQAAYANAVASGRDGEAAIREQFRTFRVSSVSKDEVEEGVAARNKELQAQINRSMEELQKTFNTRLLPLLPGLIDKFAQLTPTLGRALDFLTTLTPWQGIGLVVGGAIAKDIAAAKVGDIVGKAIELAIRAVKPSPSTGEVGSATGGSDGSVLGKTLAVAGAGAAGYGIGSLVANKVIDPMLNADERGKQAANIATMNVESVQSALRAGRISPEQAEEQRKKFADMVSQARVGGERGNAGSAIVESITGTGRGVSGFREDRSFSKNSDQVTAALEKLAQAINEKAGTIANIDMPSKGPTDPGSPLRGAAAP